MSPREIAEQHYRPEYVRINAANIAKLPLQKIIPIAAPPVEQFTRFTLCINAINYRFWTLQGSSLHEYSAHGLTDSPAMEAGMVKWWNGATFDEAFPGIPSKQKRMEALYELSQSDRLQELVQELDSAAQQGSFTMQDAYAIENLFKCYQDPYLKRAQLCLMTLAKYWRHQGKQVECSGLTLASDYQLPRVLRHYGVLEYSGVTAFTVDRRQAIPRGLTLENAIRAATVLAGDIIAEETGIAIDSIDAQLWSYRNHCTSPFHITYTEHY